jgi:hypothetical protein
MNNPIEVTFKDTITQQTITVLIKDESESLTVNCKFPPGFKKKSMKVGSMLYFAVLFLGALKDRGES